MKEFMLIYTLSGLVHVFGVLYSTYLLHTCTVLRTQSLALAIGYIFYSLRWFSRYVGLFCQLRSRLNNFTRFNLRSGPIFLTCYILTSEVRVINSNFFSLHTPAFKCLAEVLITPEKFVAVYSFILLVLP